MGRNTRGTPPTRSRTRQTTAPLTTERRIPKRLDHTTQPINNIYISVIYPLYIMSKKMYVGAWVETTLVDIVKMLSETQGVSQSEYLRQLIIQDLDKRTVFTTQLKKDIAQTA